MAMNMSMSWVQRIFFFSELLARLHQLERASLGLGRIDKAVVELQGQLGSLKAGVSEAIRRAWPQEGVLFARIEAAERRISNLEEDTRLAMETDSSAAKAHIRWVRTTPADNILGLPLRFDNLQEQMEAIERRMTEAEWMRLTQNGPPTRDGSRYTTVGCIAKGERSDENEIEQSKGWVRCFRWPRWEAQQVEQQVEQVEQKAQPRDSMGSLVAKLPYPELQRLSAMEHKMESTTLKLSILEDTLEQGPLSSRMERLEQEWRSLQLQPLTSGGLAQDSVVAGTLGRYSDSAARLCEKVASLEAAHAHTAKTLEKMLGDLNTTLLFS